MKKILLSLFLFTQVALLKSQTYYYYSEVEYTYGPYYFDQSMGLVKDLLQERKNEKLRQEYKEKLKKQTTTMRDYYASLGSYPSQIPDGWHEVSIIVGESFIDNRKVLVENNKIKEVVWDNWMPEEITFSGPIINGKSAIQYKKPTVNTEGLVEVFFMNSIADNNSMATEPLRPGVLTFWTKSNAYKTMRVAVNDYDYSGFSKQHLSNVECGDINAFNVYLKPGIHNYKGYASGFIPLINENVEVKSGECIAIEIVKPLSRKEQKELEKRKKEEEKRNRKEEKKNNDKV